MHVPWFEAITKVLKKELAVQEEKMKEITKNGEIRDNNLIKKNICEGEAKLGR